MFRVKINRRAFKFLEKLDHKTRHRIFSAIDKLSDPFSLPYEKLKEGFTIGFKLSYLKSSKKHLFRRAERFYST